MKKIDSLYVVETHDNGEVVGICSDWKHLNDIVYNYLWFDEILEIIIINSEDLNIDEKKIEVRKTYKNNQVDVDEFYVTSIQNIKL